MRSEDVVVVGAGFGGLSAAALLAKKGHKVTALEKLSEPGGRARAFKKDGFTFDMGPSWYLMPDIFEAFFEELGTVPGEHLKLTQLDPAYRVFFEDGRKFDIVADKEKNFEMFDSFEKDGAKKLKKFLEVAEYQYRISTRDFLDQSYRSPFVFLKPSIIKDSIKLNVFQNIEKYVHNIFESNEARKILQYNIVFLGSYPKETPALYSVISHVDLNLGVWYPEGGMNAVAEAIYEIAKDLGVEFHFNTPVSKIETYNGSVKEVITEEKSFKARHVVMNADYHHAETQLLDKKNQTYKQRYWDKATVAPSALIIYLGLNKKIEKLAHHTLMLQNDWTRHFEEIFNQPKWTKEPSYYICTASKTDNTIAPEGKENLFILVPLAAGLKDTPEIREKYTEFILQHVEKQLGESIRDAIEVKKVYAHNDFTKDYNAFKGTGLGLSHTLRQTAIFRPKNYSKKVDNLWYTGQYTNPGVGVPMALISSQIVANEIENTRR